MREEFQNESGPPCAELYSGPMHRRTQQLGRIAVTLARAFHWHEKGESQIEECGE